MRWPNSPERGHEIGRRVPRILLRRVEGLAGAVELEMELAPRLEYAAPDRPARNSG